ncbi:MAG: VWA domain-containing protein [Thermodesulfobacteriota bacterium]
MEEASRLDFRLSLSGRHKPDPDLSDLLESWKKHWPEALEAWSRFTKLTEPRWCLTQADEAREELSASFAMIRLEDHAIAISLRQVRQLGLDPFAVEIMAHEIGHHVYAPADLRDNARLIARTRAGLPTREAMSGYIANLYTDLLINDRLERAAELKMAEVYRKLKSQDKVDRLWALYMRIYEVLWSLPPGTLIAPGLDGRIQSDAVLGARVIRSYAKDWLEGAGRFAALCLPYLLEQAEKAAKSWEPWLDTLEAGAGTGVPDGLAEIEEGELEGALHPAEDPDLSGLGRIEKENEPSTTAPRTGGRETVGGRKNQYRDPKEYTDLMKSLGVKISEREMIIRYYRERAVPHLIKFPRPETPEATDPHPEGLDTWDPGSPLSDVDWTETLVRGLQVIPGVTTVRRTYGAAPGHQPEKLPVDLYLGVDCSGSMMNPAVGLSYPILAGTIIVLSALRAGSKVMATLSGEPGEYTSTDGFIRQEREILKVLTGYLGTGYSFGVLRLKEAFLSVRKPSRPVHVLIVTDSDIFYMLKEVKGGWDIARDALAAAGGGGTMVLNLSSRSGVAKEIDRLESIGFNVHLVADWEMMIAFARAFSKAKYEKQKRPRPASPGRPAAG